MTGSKFLKRVWLREHIRDHYRPQTLLAFRELIRSIILFGKLYHDSVATNLMIKNARILFKQKKVLDKPVRIERFLREQLKVREHIAKACEGQLVSDLVSLS
jgi:hypothetical protein